MNTDDKICHVFIQWLAKEKILDSYISWLVEGQLEEDFMHILKEDPSRLVIDLFSWRHTAEGVYVWNKLHTSWEELYEIRLRNLL